MKIKKKLNNSMS